MSFRYVLLFLLFVSFPSYGELVFMHVDEEGVTNFSDTQPAVADYSQIILEPAPLIGTELLPYYVVPLRRGFSIMLRNRSPQPDSAEINRKLHAQGLGTNGKTSSVNIGSY